MGHDSHGVIQVPRYVERVRAGTLVPNQTVEIVSENEVLAVLDGRLGFGQVIGAEAMRIALDKCAKFGLSLVALRNAGHLGRIGDWAEMAAREGKVSILFVNTSGGGILVAPHGGTEAQVIRQPHRRGCASGRRPADHSGHLDLHHRRGEDPGRGQQRCQRPRRMPAGRPGPTDHRPPGFLLVATRRHSSPGRA